MKNLSFLAIAILLTVGIVITASDTKEVLGSSVDGVVAEVRATATTSVGIYSASTLYASSSLRTIPQRFCASRVITTASSPITLSFDPDFTPVAGQGHIQPASTTVVYDSGLTGCGAIKVIATGATSTITVTEFR